MTRVRRPVRRQRLAARALSLAAGAPQLAACVLAAAAIVAMAGCQGSSGVSTASDTRAVPAWDAAPAAHALEQADCAKVWRLTWPHVLAGNREAVGLLGGAVYVRGLTPPGTGTDVLARVRNLLALFGRAAEDRNAGAIEVLAAVLADDFFDEGDGKAHAACLETRTAPASCVAGARDAGLVPDFDRWVARTERLASATNAPARCALAGRGEGDVLPRRQP